MSRTGEVFTGELVKGEIVPMNKKAWAKFKKFARLAGGMDEKDFTLDRSELHIKESSPVADDGDNAGHGDGADQAATDAIEL